MVNKVIRCPKCASTDVMAWNGGGTSPIYTCRYCGHKGPGFMEEFERLGRK
jgi:Zn ribbon nucleic-acid-binding protein